MCTAVIGADFTGAAENLPRYPQDNWGKGKDGFLPGKISVPPKHFVQLKHYSQLHIIQ